MRAKIRAPTTHALPRKRLHDRLVSLWQHRLGLVVAPAGAGKTTFLAQFAETVDSVVGWYRAEPGDGDTTVLLRHLAAALAPAFGGRAPAWEEPVDAAHDLERLGDTRVLVVVDDLHALRDTPAETALAQLVEYAPPAVAVLAAARHPPALNLSRMRVTGRLLELGPDDLRFRSWEVEQLFRDFYRERLPPEELAMLTRRTEGWAAGLQLFHLATRDRRPDERRQVLAELCAHARLVREYLADDVLQHLPEHQRAFLLDTCVLGRLSGPLCDALRGRKDSVGILAELERSRLFTHLVDEGWYRYHEVLRAHLEASLIETVGEEQARARYRRAARLLEASGAYPDAVVAHCRAGDWSEAARVLGHEGEQLAAGHVEWLDRLPAALLRDDPWLLLATARRSRAAGAWGDALRDYRRAEELFGTLPAADNCRRERQALTEWVEAGFSRRSDWASLARAAVTRDPLDAAARARVLPGPQGRFVAGLAELLAGHMLEAGRLLDAAADDPAASPLLSLGSRLASSAAALLRNEREAVVDAEWVADAADELGAGWLVRLGRAVAVLGRPAEDDARLPDDWERSDRWGPALTGLLAGIRGLHTGEDHTCVTDASASELRLLRAGTLEAWCQAVAAVARARAGAADAANRAREALRSSRSAGVPGAELFARLALAQLEPQRRSEHQACMLRLVEECGVAIPEPPQVPAYDISIRCFGGFRMRLHGSLVDLGRLKPRARALLRMLALHAGRPVHREVIIDNLWPDAPADAATRSLHVAVSNLRHALEPCAPRRASSVIVREGDAYLLRLDGGGDIDTCVLDQALAEAWRARRTGRLDAAVVGFEQTLAVYRGELLPEDGPAEWVVRERDRYIAEVAAAAHALAELLLARDDHDGAVAACLRGLRVDRYHDGLWHLLVRAHEEAGEHAAAVAVRNRYAGLLAELGLVPQEARVAVGGRTVPAAHDAPSLG